MMTKEQYVRMMFDQNTDLIADEREILRKTILETLSSSISDDSDKIKIQRVESELGDFGLNNEQMNDREDVREYLKQEFVSYDNLKKLHSAIFFSDKNLAPQLQKLFEEDSETSKKIIKMDVDGIIEKEVFTFQDIPTSLTDRAIQKVFREIKIETLEKALIGQPFFIKDKFFQNLSQNNAKMVSEAMSRFAPQITEKEILENQSKIIEIILKLEKEGEIAILGKGSGEEIYCI